MRAIVFSFSLIFLTLFSIAGCERASKNEDSSDLKPKDLFPAESSSDSIKNNNLYSQGNGTPMANFEIGKPIRIDSSQTLIFEIVSHEDKQSGTNGVLKDFGESIESSGRSGNYKSVFRHNFIFLNEITQEQNLLFESGIRNITSYTIGPEFLRGEGDSEKKIRLPFIFFSVQDQDNNRDGKIDHRDITQLFLSSLEGKNLRKISPNGMDLIAWQVGWSPEIILLRCKRYFSDPKKPEKNEAVYYYSVNLAGDPVVKPLFSGEILNQLNDNIVRGLEGLKSNAEKAK